MDRKDLRAISRVRFSEAQALLKAGLPDGAYYLAGYAVECALKACIARQTQRFEFPDKKRVMASHTHNLGELVRIADLKDLLRLAGYDDPLFQRYWDIVESWSPETRYEKISPESAKELITAIVDRDHGVMKWLKRYW